jgi:hypothetical protein
MQHATVGELRVVDEPPYMVSRVIDNRDGTLSAESTVSHIVEETDDIYQTWVSYYTQFCFTINTREEFEDESWMFGGGIRMTGTIYTSCPGEGFDHNCVARRATVPMRFDSGKV